MEKDKSNDDKNETDLEYSDETMARRRTWISGGRRYYRYKADALNARRRGDRIYYDAYERGYYIVRPQTRRSFWGW